ncbi:DNA-processing protein DprA [Demequina aurantiaca]|uniref:DNA-processing protein DprA n=1 Tax=Demequina aurantiaca TaxID=676200 RepID=UPI000AFF47F9|nr:DNA-processing protein DprA [Demequina aurantiaca]
MSGDAVGRPLAGPGANSVVGEGRRASVNRMRAADEDPDSSAADADALVAWSALAEPADQGAAWLVAMLGPARALNWVRLVAANPVSATMELVQVAPQHQVDEAVRISEKWVARLDTANAEMHLEHAARCGARVVARGSQEWPGCLDDLGPLAPFALWVRGAGDLADLMATGIAIVGARSATAYGEHVTSTMAAELCDRGATVVSGGAYGIDAAAHRTALAVGSPTVAVMAGGVDRLYPAGNADMLERVLDGGVVVSEVPPGYAPHRARFLSRNRLIATARGTVVVEAAFRSGALSTARHAAAMVRPVGAVPGPVTSASSAGCHGLIRDGLASLVTTGADVLAMVEPIGSAIAAMGRDAEGFVGVADDAASGGEVKQPRRERRRAGTHAAVQEFADAKQRQAFGALGGRRTSIEDVAREAGLTLAETRSALGGLEIAGMARRDAGTWRRASPD